MRYAVLVPVVGGAAHHVLRADGLQGVVALGRLPAQHDAVGAVQHGVGHVAALGARGAGLLDHALQHLHGVRGHRSRVRTLSRPAA